ncbi:MAG TPA: serine/threonine-protein kinase [Ktedonobacteraceae bacterium]|nr:serine/threonine-protein kinase [Ktedonobacteraceae bacterium]
MQTTIPLGSILRERYVVEGLLGKGGFGAVYLVRDLRVKGNLYALKEAINPPKKDWERFLFEGELLKRLDHPSLPRVYRIFEDDAPHRAYLLMDYIEGPNLEALRQQQPGKRFSLPQVLVTLLPIIEAIHFLHCQHPPVLHRDIKPSNIIVPASGDAAVLVDFGIAKEYHPDGTTTAVRTGSPGYAAPEQYSTGTSTRSDIYGLGATFYTLLTGTIPADALYRITHMSDDNADPLEPLNQLNPDIPPYIADAIHRALSINSNHRFSTVEQFWQAFETEPTWRPLHTPVIAPLATASQPRFLQDHMESDTSTPAALARHKQAPNRRSWKSRAMLLVLLVLLIASGTWAALLAYFASHPATNPAALSPRAGGVATVIVGASPTSHPARTPVAVTTTPRPGATSTSQPVTARTPSPIPGRTPSPTATSSPSPTPTPDPYPHVAGNYNGTLDDTTDNSTANIVLSIQQQPGQGNISGHFTVHPPLVSSGPFTGTVNTSTYIQFTVTGKNTSPLYFWGSVQSNGDLSGNYCSLNIQNQCDPNAGTSGNWNVAPSTGDRTSK